MTVQNLQMGKREKVAMLLVAGVFWLLIFRNAWAADDSYIIFRTIEQFFAGHGLRWNMIERVQTYTSVLWTMMLCLARVFSRDDYLNAVLLSLFLNAASIFLLCRWTKKIWPFAMILAVLSLSNAFMDYTVSGLECPLIYFLCTGFFLAYWDFYKTRNMASAKWVFRIAGMMLLTRHDLLLVVLLPLIHVARMHTASTGMAATSKLLAWVFIPIALWTCFSLIYYGVPFPNTAYAKMGTGIPHIQMLEQGVMYFVHGFKYDFISLLIMSLAVLAGLLQKNNAYRVAACTILLVSAYIVWVGGDFMAGRFYSHLVLVALLLLVALVRDAPSPPVPALIGMIGVTLASYAVAYDHTPLNTPNIYAADESWHGVSNERAFYSEQTSIWVYLDKTQPYFPHSMYFERARHYSSRVEDPYLEGGIGIVGYGAPLDVYISDIMSLADFFRARLRLNGGGWRIGHVIRYYPPAYPNSVFDKQRGFWTPDPSLNAYLQVVKLITQDENLFSMQRLLAIVKLNTGQYSYLLDQARYPPVVYEPAYNIGCSHTWHNSPLMQMW